VGRNTVQELPDVVRIECSDDALGARRPLTPTEREVAWRMAAGMRDREIADAMRTAVRTINAHVRAVLAKCGVASRAELASRVAAHFAEAARDAAP
jgi:DNA-binding CsgD family transcriptional regulator